MKKREERPGAGRLDVTPEDAFDDERFDGSEEVTLAGLLFECAARLEQHIDTNMQRASGVAVSTFEVLIRLLRSPEHQLRLTDLGRQLAITTGGVTRLIDRLEAQDLVERVRAMDDRRAVYARLTDEGRDTVVRVLPDHIADLRKTFDALGPDRQRLEHALRLLRDIVSVPS